MKTNLKPLVVLLRALRVFVVVCLGPHGEAQSVPDGTTNVINGTAVMTSSSLIIGTNGSRTALIITNGGSLATNVQATIGDNASASSNRVEVTGSGSRWAVENGLLVGRVGSLNRLLVNSAGSVQSGYGIIGSDAASSGNVAFVAGAGSSWVNTNLLWVGANGSGGQLIVSNAGTVRSVVASYIGDGLPSSNNVALITGMGSLWSNATLVLGFSGSGNRLVVSNGATVRSSIGIVGNDVSSTNNQVVVTGGGSFWSNSANITIGGSGGGNRATVNLGGAMQAGSSIFFGNLSSGNELTVSDGGVVRGGNLVYTGKSGANNRLVVSNSGVVMGAYGTVGEQASSSSNFVLITGGGSTWSNSADLTIGSLGAGNLLVVSNGGTVRNVDGYLGFFSNANGNRIVVSGGGSVWSNGNNVFVGVDGKGNSLAVADGGLVQAVSSTVGFGATGSNNSCVVAGVGSHWRHANTLFLGYAGSSNQLVVSNGGMVSAGENIFVGLEPASSNNLVLNDGGSIIVTNASGMATFDLRRGAYRINGGTSMFDRMFIGTNAAVAGNGTISGAVFNSGSIAPGNSIGGIAFNGSLNLFASGTVSFEIGGVVPGTQHDTVSVANGVLLGGALGVSLTNGFLPAPGDTFTILSFGFAVGGFGNVSGGRVALTNGLASFAVTQTATNLVLGDVIYVDSDGDGQGDLQELAAGTDPNDPASALAVTSITDSGNIVVQFRSVPGKTYRIEHSVGVGPWSIATTNVPSAGTNTTWIDDGSLTGGLPVGQRFYRVGLQ